MNGVFDITLRAKNGEERKLLQWFPSRAACSGLYKLWALRGLQVTINKQII